MLIVLIQAVFIWVLLCLKYIFVYFTTRNRLVALLYIILVFKYLIFIISSITLFIWKILIFFSIFNSLTLYIIVVSIISDLTEIFWIADSLLRCQMINMHVYWMVIELLIKQRFRLLLKFVLKWNRIHLLILKSLLYYSCLARRMWFSIFIIKRLCHVAVLFIVESLWHLLHSIILVLFYRIVLLNLCTLIILVIINASLTN